MRVLIVGSGGREHALAWKLAQSPKVSKVYTAPGNPGTAEVGENVNLSSDDIPALAAFAKENGVDLTVVGPEAPLVEGIVDRFRDEGLRVFGPVAAAAQLEGSKDFAKQFMLEFGIPTARAMTFDALDPAIEYVQSQGAPIVIKADGLAAGKGVTVALDLDTAIAALRDCFEEKVFGEAGARVVVEEYMRGEEASVLALCDGETFVALPSSQDHKPAFDGDKGPNTGGMGAYSPAPVLTPEINETVERTILQPVIDGMKRRGTPYVGVLYAGLMISDKGPRVVEFNVRMGDPETQAVLPATDSDLFELIWAATEGDLASVGPVEANPLAAVCVVLASEGYPGSYPKGKKIEGTSEVGSEEGVIVFHAGTKTAEDGSLVTSGGRVLGVTARGTDIRSAIEKAYEAVAKIGFEGVQFRTDIGKKALDRLS